MLNTPVSINRFTVQIKAAKPFAGNTIMLDASMVANKRAVMQLVGTVD